MGLAPGDVAIRIFHEGLVTNICPAVWRPDVILSRMKSNFPIFFLVLVLLFGCNTTPEFDGAVTAPELHISPNPAIYSVSLFINNTDGPGRLKIFQGEGKVFMEGNVIDGENRLDVDVSGWPEGKYKVVVELANKNIVSQFLKLQ